MNWEDYGNTVKGSDAELKRGVASVEYVGSGTYSDGEPYEDWNWEATYHGMAGAAVSLAAKGSASSLRQGKDRAARAYEALAEACRKMGP